MAQAWVSCRRLLPEIELALHVEVWEVKLNSSRTVLSVQCAAQRDAKPPYDDDSVWREPEVEVAEEQRQLELQQNGRDTTSPSELMPLGPSLVKRPRRSSSLLAGVFV